MRVSVLPQRLAQVLVHRLEDHAQVVLVVEAAQHLDAVALVVGVSVGELLEVADLLLTWVGAGVRGYG